MQGIYFLISFNFYLICLCSVLMQPHMLYFHHEAFYVQTNGGSVLAPCPGNQQVFVRLFRFCLDDISIPQRPLSQPEQEAFDLFTAFFCFIFRSKVKRSTVM